MVSLLTNVTVLLTIVGNDTASSEPTPGASPRSREACNYTGVFSCPNPYLESYAKWYWGVHGYWSLVICAFGITTNSLNIIILTRRAMRTSINCILTAIAICDLVTMCSYIPFASHFYIESGLQATANKYSYGWTTFMAVHSNATHTTYGISLWLAVFMAILRYVYLQTKKCCDLRQTCIVCIFICISWCIFMVPSYILTQVIPMKDGNVTFYKLNDNGIFSASPSTLSVISFWLIAVLGKLVPCVLISIFIGLLLKKLHESAVRRKRLFAHSDKNRKNNGKASSRRSGGGPSRRSGGGPSRAARHQCTTTMLLVIIVMYIVTEIPQVVFILMSAMYKNFFLNVYMLLADTMDMISLVNNAINFVLYCTMSQQFREHLLVAKACTGTTTQTSRFGKKNYRSVEQSGANNQTHTDNGLCVTMTTEKSISRV